MSILVSSTPAPTPKTKNVTTIATLYAGMLVVMVTLQLFSFDTFLKLVSSFSFPGGASGAYFLAAFTVASEVYALPFLLRMSLSRAFRWLSMVLGWLAALIWITISISLIDEGGRISNIGFLGTVVKLMPGWWAVGMSIALGILAAWAAWGMWPYQKKRLAVNKQSERLLEQV